MITEQKSIFSDDDGPRYGTRAIDLLDGKSFPIAMEYDIDECERVATARTKLIGGLGYVLKTIKLNDIVPLLAFTQAREGLAFIYNSEPDIRDALIEILKNTHDGY